MRKRLFIQYYSYFKLNKRQMSSDFQLPDNTIILEHQIAGHTHEHGKLYTGMLKHTDGFVMKPVQDDTRGKNEIQFYEEVFQSSNPVACKLQRFIPQFLGLHQYMYDSRVQYFIKLEDIAAGCKKPCIADIKIGRQTWDPSASPEKKSAESDKYRGTKEPLGFCIPGLWIHELASGNVLKLDKFYGRRLDAVTVRDALRQYLNGSEVMDRRLVAEFLHQLQTIQEWFEEQRHFLFFATSLLLVYDADTLSQNEAINVKVRMIDFAHVYPAHGARDSNYLEGLCNLIDIFKDFYQQSTNCQ